MSELRVPPVVENPFRAHYRKLILGSALRLAETEIERLHADGYRRRAVRAERLAASLREATGAPARPVYPAAAPQRWFGGELRRFVGALWVAAAALLGIGVVGFGLHSWATTAADLALLVLTAAWFGVSVDDLVPPPEPRPEQLELFEWHASLPGAGGAISPPPALALARPGQCVRWPRQVPPSLELFEWSGQVVFDHVIPPRLAPSSLAFERSASVRFEPERFAPCRLASRSVALVRSAPARSEPSPSIECSVDPVRLAPGRKPPCRFASSRFVLERFPLA